MSGSSRDVRAPEMSGGRRLRCQYGIYIYIYIQIYIHLYIYISISIPGVGFGHVHNGQHGGVSHHRELPRSDETHDDAADEQERVCDEGGERSRDWRDHGTHVRAHSLHKIASAHA